MSPFLSRYPDWLAARLLQVGFTEGLFFPCSLLQIRPAADNLRSAMLHSEVVSEKLSREVLMDCMCGPFYSSPLE